MDKPIIQGLAGTETEKNLQTALRAESAVWLRYMCAARTASEESYCGIAETFTSIADNERAHGEIWLRLLGGCGNTEAHLREACSGEHREWEEMYAGFAETAKREGFAQIAQLFAHVASVERSHEETFGGWLRMMADGKIFYGAEGTVWRCLNCGFLFVGKEPPSECPACSHPRAFFVRNQNA